ncbi:MAG: hypothetical protein DRG78_00140 [Epsilonproteobacteria bacterium]|nr:MAG: hypothetical protein DRG78_00140 [Campylobacterota bacterium]
MSEQPILSSNTRTYVEDSAFNNDTFNRKQLADKLTTYLERLKDGAVLSIDAPWGSGKSWFGRNWAKQLEDEEYNVVYIDAFEQDYIEDPFMLITAEILDTIEDGNALKDDLKKGAVEVGKALLPVAGKAIANLVGKVLLASPDLTGEVQEAITGGTTNIVEMTSEYIKENLESYGQDKLAMVEFKDKLSQYAQTQEKPIVIFVDELDRCKPNFAVSLVERIKHLFDVPNVVFVLLLNREQLEKAVQGVYGSGTDASNYLGKFINFFFSLPQTNSSGDNYTKQDKLHQFVNLTMGKYKFELSSTTDSFAESIIFMAYYFNLSLRDIEKSCALYAFAYPLKDYLHLLVYVIILKVKNIELFNKLVVGDISAHIEAKNTIENLIRDVKIKNDQYGIDYLPFYSEWHEAYINGFNNVGKNFSNEIDERDFRDIKTIFPYFAKKIDLDI